MRLGRELFWEGWRTGFFDGVAAELFAQGLPGSGVAVARFFHLTAGRAEPQADFDELKFFSFQGESCLAGI